MDNIKATNRDQEAFGGDYFGAEKDKVKNSYEDGVCPDCSEDIPDDCVDGQECSNCGHVFYRE